MKTKFLFVFFIINSCVLFSQSYVYDRVDFPNGWKTYKFNDTLSNPVLEQDSLEMTNELKFFYPLYMSVESNTLIYQKELLGDDSIYVVNLEMNISNDTIYFIDTVSKQMLYYGIDEDTIVYFPRYQATCEMDNSFRMSLSSLNIEYINNAADTLVPKFDSLEDSLSILSIRVVMKQSYSDCIPGLSYSLNETISHGDSLQVGDSVFYHEGNYTIPLTDVNDCDSIIILNLKVEHNALNHSLEYGEVIDIEGNIYKTIPIGSQLWMAENLKVTKYNNGEDIPLVTDDNKWNELSTPGYCWYDNDSITYSVPYGALYNWYVVETNKICPTGWHVPSLAEGQEFANYLLSSGLNYDNSLTGNKIAKSISSSVYWNNSTNEGAVGNNDYPHKQNITGFSAVPGGYRMTNHNSFSYNGDVGFWWSSSVCEASDGGCNVGTSVWLSSISYNYPDFSASTHSKGVGYSVRCIKNIFTVTDADFEANQVTIYENEKVSFIDNSTGDVTRWSWDFGDGGTSIEQNPNHTYTVAGTYTVSLSVAGAEGSDTETKTDYIIVTVPAPIADFSTNVTAGNIALSVNFIDNSTGEIDNWSWDYGDGGTSIEQNPSHVYTEAGSYTVALTVTGVGGSDTETKTDYITVNTPTDISDLTTNDKILIFPNPTKSICKVIIPDGVSRTVDIKVYNNTGKELVTETGIKDKIYELDLSKFSIGTYYIFIISDNDILTDKLIIAK